jgi:hypothetical protein
MPVLGYELLQEQFEQSVLALAQQKESVLGPYVSRGTVHSASTRYSNLAKITAVQRTQRHAPTPNTEQTLSNRWTVQQMWELHGWIDRHDDQRSILTNLAGDFVNNFTAALNRVEDQIILTAMGGTAVTGQTGTGTAALPTASKVAVNDHSYDPDAGSADTALTVYKLQKARALMGGANGNIDGLVEVALGWNQLMALCSDTRFASWYNNSARPLETMNLSWMGYRFHAYEDSLVRTNAGADELVYVWIDRAIRMDTIENLFTRITEDEDHSFDLDVYQSKTLGAVRRDDSLVIEIACDPTPTL